MPALSNEPATDWPETPGRRAKLARSLATAFAVMLCLAAVAGCSDSKKSASSSSSATPTTSQTDGLLQQGLDAQTAGHLDIARQKYADVLQQDPANKFAHYNLGVIAQQLKDDAGARDEYNKAIAIDAAFQPALFNLATVESTTNPTRAEALYRQLITIDANDANSHFNLGLLLKGTGNATDGDAELAKAVQLNPSLASRVPTATTQPPG